jgi:hypothetical protein
MAALGGIGVQQNEHPHLTPGPGPAGARLEASGLPTEWTRVLEQQSDALNPKPLPVYVWLELPGKVLHVEGARLEFMDERPVRGLALLRFWVQPRTVGTPSSIRGPDAIGPPLRGVAR